MNIDNDESTQINWDNVGLLAPGIYEAKIERASREKSAAGNACLQLDLIVAGRERVRDKMPFSTSFAQRHIKQIALSMSLGPQALPRHTGEIETFCTAILRADRSIWVSVKHETYNNELRVKVADYVNGPPVAVTEPAVAIRTEPPKSAAIEAPKRIKLVTRGAAACRIRAVMPSGSELHKLPKSELYSYCRTGEAPRVATLREFIAEFDVLKLGEALAP